MKVIFGLQKSRLLGGMKQAVHEGRYVWCAPPGYSNLKINNKSNIAPNEKGPLITQAFQEVAKAFYSINEVRIMMASVGLAQKDGKPLAKSRFYHLLKNEIYTGWITKFGERVKGDFDSVINRALY